MIRGMQTERSLRGVALAGLLALIATSPGGAAPSGQAHPDREHAGPHRPPRPDRTAPQDRGRDLRRGAEPSTACSGDRWSGSSSTTSPSPRWRAASTRSSSPSTRSISSWGPTPPARSWPRWAWPSATRRCSSTTRSACRTSPSTRCTSPRPVRAGAEQDRAHHGVRCPRCRPQAPQDRGHRHQQVPVDPVHLVGRPRRGREARAQGRPLSRVRVRHARLGRHRGAGQGRQARSSCGSARWASTATSSSRR